MSGSPRGPEQYPYVDLAQDAFEELCYLVVREDYPDANRLRAPDGGLDIILSVGDTVVRGWQVKRHTASIDWRKCAESLDRAFHVHRPLRVTFCFPIDLTVNQNQRFRDRIGRRHPDIEVDYVGASWLTGAIARSDNGRRIARRFFHVNETSSEILRSVRAAGAPENIEAAADRMSAVRELLDANDPNFDYSSASASTADLLPKMHGSTIMSVGMSGPDGVTRFDAIARGTEAPKITLDYSQADETQINAFRLATRFGGVLPLDGVSVGVENLPRAFEKLILELGGSSSAALRLIPRIPDWPISLVAIDESGEHVRIPITMKQIEGEADDQTVAAMAGEHAGLSLRAAFRVDPQQDAASIGFTWKLRLGGWRASEQYSVAKVVRILSDGGRVDVVDRSGSRPTISGLSGSFTGDQRDHIRAVCELLEDAALVESSAREPIVVPENLTDEQLDELARAAVVVRQKGTFVTDFRCKLSVENAQYDEARKSSWKEFRARVPIIFNVFGREMCIGAIDVEPDFVRIEKIEPDPYHAGRICASLVGGFNGRRWADLRNVE